MTVVFVHGVPETAAVWDPLVAAVGRDDVACLSLPGFATPLPDDFEPTMYRYAEWLGEQLSTFDDVDLVAHDWGALLSMRVLADQPANVHTWALDTGDLTDDHRWHGAARTWQTPGDGEAVMDGWLALPADERGQPLVAVGAPEPAAAIRGAALDATMGRAILGLYRSAVRIGVEWGPGIDKWRAKGLVVSALQDSFRKPELAVDLARRTGAEILELPECGHWWMQQEPELVAAALHRFWSDV
jgi:pimeloyl-ACP methyl ester carboxylesterase